MVRGLGPRSHRVYTALRDRILSGALPPGTCLPSQSALAAEFGVTVVTLRQALRLLEAQRLITCEHGRGTFVRAASPPAVLVVDDEAGVRAILRAHITAAGYRVVEAAGPATALAALADDPAIVLVLSDVRMYPEDEVVGFAGRPDMAVGITFIQTVRRRWPDLPLAAVTGYPDDLAVLHGTPDCPILVISKPFRAAQIAELLRLVGRDAPRLTDTEAPAWR